MFLENLEEKKRGERKGPSHFGFSTADLVLELIVEVEVPIEGLRGRGRATNIEVREGLIVSLTVQVLRLEDYPIAVENQSLERRRRRSRD